MAAIGSYHRTIHYHCTNTHSGSYWFLPPYHPLPLYQHTLRQLLVPTTVPSTTTVPTHTQAAIGSYHRTIHYHCTRTHCGSYWFLPPYHPLPLYQHTLRQLLVPTTVPSTMIAPAHTETATGSYHRTIHYHCTSTHSGSYWFLPPYHPLRLYQHTLRQLLVSTTVPSTTIVPAHTQAAIGFYHRTIHYDCTSTHSGNYWFLPPCHPLRLYQHTLRQLLVPTTLQSTTIVPVLVSTTVQSTTIVPVLVSTTTPSTTIVPAHTETAIGSYHHTIHYHCTSTH